MIAFRALEGQADLFRSELLQVSQKLKEKENLSALVDFYCHIHSFFCIKTEEKNEFYTFFITVYFHVSYFFCSEPVLSCPSFKV